MAESRKDLSSLDPEYKRWYNRGWRYSLNGSGSQSLDYLDSIGAPDAMYDGYLDACSREKWHLAFCQGCGDHPDLFPALDLPEVSRG